MTSTPTKGASRASRAPHSDEDQEVRPGPDGLLLDASRIASASGVTLALNQEAIAPLAPQGRLEDAMRWGDDYVLLCTGPAGLEAGLPVTRIGEVLEGGPSPLLLDGAPPQGDLGYTH